MPNSLRNHENGGIYHIFNRGVDKRTIFLDKIDYARFIKTLIFYQQEKNNLALSQSDFAIEDRQPPLRFDLIAYCLMPNHFHLMLKQTTNVSVSLGISQLLNSYTKYFNQRNQRTGHLFQGKYKSVKIESDEQFIHLARYIFLNPFTARISDNIDNYSWSAYPEYIGQKNFKLCEHKYLLDYFKNRDELVDFVKDYGHYIRGEVIVNEISLD